MAGPGEVIGKNEAGITGTWQVSTQKGTVTAVLNADGSGTLNGIAFTYVYQAPTLTITAQGKSISYNAVVSGDSLTMSGGDLSGPVTFHRAGAAGAPSTPPPAVTGPMADVAGVWTNTESSVDPSIAIIYTQYITLFPNGTFSWAKSEGGASRTQLDQYTEQFRSWNQSSPTMGDAGTWETDGSSVTLRWARYSYTSDGQVDLGSNSMSLSHTGVIDQGATLTFNRQ
jgi:hypothetical protein